MQCKLKALVFYVLLLLHSLYNNSVAKLNINHYNDELKYAIRNKASNITASVTFKNYGKKKTSNI